ncbi:MAG: ABC transporter ATP-binding protein [Lachnospiraceae bacterium]|nr:ABC transporter ATP-binding protein [Lachnospiraceae bacterium]
MEFLKVENLCKIYGKGDNQVKALDNVSLTIDKGDFTAIIGTSGSGKSTLLHAIAGVDVPTGGKIYLDGQDIYGGNNEQLAIFRRRQVGLIYQFHNLIPTLNVVENITLPILMDRRKVNKERLNDLLELLGLQERRHHLPNQLSGGQQQRVAIGRALMNAPAVMLADEPTGSLDSRNGHEIIKLLKESNQKYGQTLILVTHDESIALQADRIITIADGRVVRDGRVFKPDGTMGNGRKEQSDVTMGKGRRAQGDEEMENDRTVKPDGKGHNSTGLKERQVAQR